MKTLIVDPNSIVTGPLRFLLCPEDISVRSATTENLDEAQLAKLVSVRIREKVERFVKQTMKQGRVGYCPLSQTYLELEKGMLVIPRFKEVCFMNCMDGRQVDIVFKDRFPQRVREVRLLKGLGESKQWCMKIKTLDFFLPIDWEIFRPVNPVVNN